MSKVTKELAIKILSTRDRYGCLCGWTSGYTEALDMAVEALQERPTGKWSIDSIDELELSYGGMAYEPVYKCSYCGRVTESYVRFDKPIMPEDADFPNFCGWCGARMKGADDE